MFHYKKNHPTSKQNGPIMENGRLVIRTRWICSFDVFECKINLQFLQHFRRRIIEWLKFLKNFLCCKGKDNHVDNEIDLEQAGDRTAQVEGVALDAGDLNSRARFNDTNQECDAEEQEESVADQRSAGQTNDESEDEEHWYFSDDDSISLPSIFGSDTEDGI